MQQHSALMTLASTTIHNGHPQCHAVSAGAGKLLIPKQHGQHGAWECRCWEFRSRYTDPYWHGTLNRPLEQAFFTCKSKHHCAACAGLLKASMYFSTPSCSRHKYPSGRASRTACVDEQHTTETNTETNKTCMWAAWAER
jgi:hypothetical protein